MASYSLVLAAVLLVVGCLMLRKTKTYWLKLLFPVGYFLYTRTQLGYRFHLHQLRKKRSSPHSITQPISLPGVTIVPVPILDDNYAYLVIDTVSNLAVAVDPSDAEAVKRSVQQRNVTLKAVLTTHKHWDHSGGNEVLLKEFPGLAVYGGAKDNVPGSTHLLLDTAIVKVGRLTFEALWTPGHTVGNSPEFICGIHNPGQYATREGEEDVGDFVTCVTSGKIFEGDAETMLKSLSKVAELPRNSLIFPGHEYAWLNMKFASSLQPAHTQVQNKWQWVKQQRAQKLATVPSILSEELQYNLFMSPGSGGAGLKNALGLPHHSNDARVLTELRKQKNAYKPFD